MAFDMRSALAPLPCWISNTSRQLSRDFIRQNSTSRETLTCSSMMWFIRSGKAISNDVRAHVLTTTPPKASVRDDVRFSSS